MSINLYNPSPLSTEVAIYNPVMSACPPCPSTQGPTIPQGVLESLFLLVGMLLQYALIRFRIWTKERRAGTKPEATTKEENHYEEASYHPGPSAPPPSVCLSPPSPPPNHGGLVINVGNPFTNPFVNGPHQG